MNLPDHLKVSGNVFQQLCDISAAASPTVCGSPLFLAYPHNVTSARTCTVAKSTGSLTQGRIAIPTTQAGMLLGTALPGN